MYTWEESQLRDGTKMKEPNGNSRSKKDNI